MRYLAIWPGGGGVISGQKSKTHRNAESYRPSVKHSPQSKVVMLDSKFDANTLFVEKIIENLIH